MNRASKTVAVIGAGWAGCAAAVELARRGIQVTLFESARELGGRARCVHADGKQLDNGQHILLGAYAETLRLMRMVGIDIDQVLLRLPLQMRYPPGSGGMDFMAARLPAPLHLIAALLRAHGLTRDDKMALARFSTTARWMDWRLDTDCSVAELLDRYDQTERLTKLMWRPLCIAALNTPPERASAQVFLNVLRDSLGARRAASDMLIPRVNLTALFPQQAAAFVERHGGTVRCGTTVKHIERGGNGWLCHISDGSFTKADAVIIATQPTHATTLLEQVPGTTPLPPFEYEPITTCYLRYSPEVRLAQPLFALIDDANAGEWGQFVFDRGHLDGNDAGLFAIVVSTSSGAIAAGNDTLAGQIALQLAKVFSLPELAHPKWVKVITEKRATFACTPGLVRPSSATGMDGLFLAGDYVTGEYPATLEAAVRSGVGAVRLLDSSENH